MEDAKQKSLKTRRETSVQGTNDSSVVSKCSTATCGYFDDQFLHHFVAKQSRRAPLIHRGYYIRAVAFDRIFRKFLSRHSGEKTQIVSLGCGFDSTYFRLKNAGLLQDTKFFEIDFPELVRRKHKIIESKEVLMTFLDKKIEPPLSPHIELSCQDYHLLGCDLTQLNTLEAALKMCGLDFEIPTLLFSECVMTYMTRRCSTDLVRWAADTFENGAFALYEQMNPDDAFGLFMQQHFHSIGSPLKCINAFPTVESQRQKFLKNGWKKCEAVDMNTFYYQCLDEGDRDHVESLEAFDEYEELNLKYSHYFILVASIQDSDTAYLESESKKSDSMSRKTASDLVRIDSMPSTNYIHRFGHSSSFIGGEFVLTTGGFGEVDGRHQRLTDITITDVKTLESHHIPCMAPHVEYSRMHHVSVTLSDGSIYLLAGRQSPYFMCSQMLKLTLNRNSKPTSSNSDQTQHSPDTLPEKQVVNRQTCNTCPSMKNGINKTTSCSVIDAQCKGLSEPHIWQCPYGELQVELVQQCGQKPGNRWRHAAIAVCIEGTEKIFLHGGKTKSGEILDDAYLFDPNTLEWSQVTYSGDVPGPRHSHHAVTWRNYVLLTGGMDDKQVPLSDVHLLNLNSGVWERLAVSGYLHARFSHTAQILNDKLILIGGVHLLHPPPGIGLVDLTTRRASEYDLPTPDKSKLLMLHRITSVKLPDDRILVIGGGGNCFSFGTHLNHTPLLLDLNEVLSLSL